jgi:predicted solute-binding protein
MIGDAAVSSADETVRRRYHDLGSLWKTHTGLPFVFAVWSVSSRNLRCLTRFAPSRRGDSRRKRNRLARSRPSLLIVMTKHIRYDIGAREEEGIRL